MDKTEELKKTKELVEAIGYVLTKRAQFTGEEAERVLEMVRWLEGLHKGVSEQLAEAEKAIAPKPQE